MITTSFIIAFTVLFIHACTWEGMILEFVDRWLCNAPAWLRKPLYDCPICMSVYYGIFIYAIGLDAGWIKWQGVGLGILTLFVAGGISTVLSNLVDWLQVTGEAATMLDGKDEYPDSTPGAN